MGDGADGGILRVVVGDGGDGFGRVADCLGRDDDCKGVKLADSSAVRKTAKIETIRTDLRSRCWPG